MNNPDLFSKGVIIQEGFFDFLDKIKNESVLPKEPDPHIPEVYVDPNSSGSVVEPIEKDKVYELSVSNGNLVSKRDITVAAYDESINRYSALEGKVAYVSHSLVYLYKDSYYPTNELTLLFATRSTDIIQKNPGALHAKEYDVDTTINIKISEQKYDFLKKYVCDQVRNVILLVDGPFIAGDGYSTFKKIKKEFVESNTTSIFIVKNSFSSLIIDHMEDAKGKYNSDLHWSNTILKEGQRTCFYRYYEPKSPLDNTKVFCYLKFSERSSPIRVELPTDVYYQNKESIDDYMDLIFYYILVQGNFKNPQARPIAIAEMFARETLGLIDFNKQMRFSHLTSTMNQERGMDYDN